MTDAPRICLAQQIEAVRFAETRQRTLAQGGSIKGMRGQSVEEYDLKRLSAAARTLEWMERHEAAIRDFVAARRASS